MTDSALKDLGYGGLGLVVRSAVVLVGLACLVYAVYHG